MSILSKLFDEKSKLLLATASGLLTILLWSSSSVTITSLPNIPRFQLLWFGFGEAFIIGSIILVLTGRVREMIQPFAVLLIVGGAVVATYPLKKEKGS